jgi:hypothetical protein
VRYLGSARLLHRVTPDGAMMHARIARSRRTPSLLLPQGPLELVEPVLGRVSVRSANAHILRTHLSWLAARARWLSSWLPATCDTGA